MKSFFILALFLPVFSQASLVELISDPLDVCSEKSQTAMTTKESQITFSIFLNKENKLSDKAILILPPTGGRNALDEGFANMFCKKGFTVYVLERWTGDSPYDLDLNVHNEYMKNTHLAIKKILDLIPQESVGVLGTSAGGIVFNSMLNRINTDKISAYFTIASGLSLCKMLANSGEKTLAKAREERLLKFNFANDKEYENSLCKTLKWDTSPNAPEHIKVAALISKVDTTVPAKYQEKLVKDWKLKFIIESNCDHFGAIVSSYIWYRGSILNFFEENV